ncbi:hypothetical protein NM688_g7677 [Phlebia brevispora]|uniref:Uncharacterized protein n=1 Tax=Phlebia brevispora TaxID=194682 RepID=A0ACC1S2E5_9APHY|nr:hypothetical protein NM688_g7677 [Phlebia brevispora]
MLIGAYDHFDRLNIFFALSHRHRLSLKLTLILNLHSLKMSLGTLYTTPEQAQGKRLMHFRFAHGRVAGLKVDLPEHYVHFQDNKKPEFLAKFPHGKIPALDGADGFRVFETSAVARYIASLAPNSTLLGSNNKEQALIDQWISVADSEIAQYINLVNQLCRGMIPYSKPVRTHHLR